MLAVSHRDFTSEDKSTLIKLIRDHPAIWDPNNKQRLKRTVVNAAYSAIAKEMTADGTRVFTGRHFLISLSPKTMFSQKPEGGVEESP